MSEQKFISAANLFGWGQSFNATGKFPLIAKRVWNTYDDMIAFVSDTSDVCPAGVVLTVVNDTDSKKNGAYFVASCPTLENPELPVDVQKIGSGETFTADNYDAAVLLATDDNVGAIIYVKSDSENGTKGPYVVAGAGSIQKLGTTTATGDLSTDVSNLKSIVDTLTGNDETEGSIDNKIKTAVDAIEIPVKDVHVNNESVLGEDGIVKIDLSGYTTGEEFGGLSDALGELDESVKGFTAKLDEKVSKEDGKRLMTDAEGTKLAGIAEGAQVNVIEVVKVNGTALTVSAADKSVDVIVPTAPVQGVADEEKVLSLDGDKLKTTLTLAYVPATETDNAVLRLQGKDGAVVSSIDATAFVKDGMLEGAKLEGPKEGESGEKYLVLTFNTAAGKEDIRMDVSDLLDYYAAGDGLTLDGKTFKVKLDETANKYLQVTTNGVAVSQTFLDKITELDNAIYESACAFASGAAETVKLEVIGDKDSDTKETLSIHGVRAYADDLVNSLDGNKVSTSDFEQFKNDVVTPLQNTVNGIKVTDVDTDVQSGIGLTLNEGVVAVSVNRDDLVLDLVGSTNTPGPISGVSVILGQAITDGAEENPTEIISAHTTIHSAIQTLAGKIETAIAGGITAIDGGQYITVGGTATSKTLGLKIDAIAASLVSTNPENSSALKVQDGQLALVWEEI